MPAGDDALQDLREALKQSPDNVPLRQMLGDLLLKRGVIEEAEACFREGLRIAPASEQLKLGLARCFFEQGKNSAAIVILEELVKRPDIGAAAFLLQARVLLRTGALDQARSAYRRAVDSDPELADPQLAEIFELEPAVIRGRQDDTEPPPPEPGPAEPPIPPRPQARVVYGAPHPHAPSTELERPQITFEHVGGMDALKEEIRLKIVHPLRHPQMYEAYGQRVGGGMLLYGPPGCGKTHLARATAGEVDAAFIVVGIHDVLDMYLGQSEQKLHEIFEQARRHRPCVLFFDEVDALGANRADFRHSSARQLINQFLAEMDGAQSSNEGVLALGATNAPWHLDPAFRRPGRFDRILFVPPPDRVARVAIFRILLQEKPVAEIDLEALARKTDGFSGADLKAIVEHAVEGKLRKALQSGAPSPLRTRDLEAALKQVKPSTREWFATARNYALFANQGGAYDEILKHLKLA